MFQNVITTEFIERFNALNDIVADVYIKHILYGQQKIRGCVLHTLLDGERIGLIINEEEKYITADELVNAYVHDDELLLKSNVMEIKLKLE